MGKSRKGNRAQGDAAAIKADLAASGAFKEAFVDADFAKVEAQRTAAIEAEREAAFEALKPLEVAVDPDLFEAEILAGKDPRLAGRLGIDTLLIVAGTHTPTDISEDERNIMKPHRRTGKGSQAGGEYEETRKAPGDRIAQEELLRLRADAHARTHDMK